MSIRNWFSRVTGLFQRRNNTSLDPQTYFLRILEDVQIEAQDEFDRNFERKAFFNEAWPETKWQNQNGSLLMRSGHLRSSINSSIQGDGIVFTSNLPYASIHNEGGKIQVTAQMKKFFWAKYYETKGNTASATSWNTQLAGQTAIWKAMALKSLGSHIKIEQRQFIGDHPMVDEFIKEIVDENMQQLEQDIANLFNR